MFPFFLFLSSAFAKNDVQNPKEALQVGYLINMMPILRTNPDFNSETSEDNSLITKQGIQLNIHGKWKGLQIKSSLQDVRIWGAEEVSFTFTRDNMVALHEGYVQLDEKIIG